MATRVRWIIISILALGVVGVVLYFAIIGFAPKTENTNNNTNMSASHSHSYVRTYKSEGNCIEHIYTYTCSICGASREVESAEFGKHQFNSEGFCDICGISQYWLKFGTNQQGAIVTGMGYHFDSLGGTLDPNEDPLLYTYVPRSWNDMPVVAIEAHAFSETRYFFTLVLPATIQSIGCGAFEGSSYGEIVFQGTMTEWAQVDKDMDWAGKIKVVRCTDGVWRLDAFDSNKWHRETT